MKANTLIWLVVLALGLSALAWFLTAREAAEHTVAERGLFAPELDSRLDDVTAVEIHAAGEQPLRIERQGNAGWVLPAKAGYTVDAAKLRELLRSLARVEVLEAKTANPEWHGKLKLTPVGEAEDSTVEVVALAGDEPLLAVLLGSRAQGGQFARRSSENQTWLLAEALSPPRTASEWLDKSLVDIKRADLRAVEVQPADAERYTLAQAEGSTDFLLTPAPPVDRETNAANINRLLAALSSLRLLDVRDATAEDDGGDWRQLRFLRKDGLAVEARVRQDGGDYWLRLQAQAPETLPAAAPQLEGEGGDTETEAEAADPGATLAALRDEAAALNSRARNRVFQISSYPGTGLLLAYEQLLKPPPEDDAAE